MGRYMGYIGMYKVAYDTNMLVFVIVMSMLMRWFILYVVYIDH